MNRRSVRIRGCLLATAFWAGLSLIAFGEEPQGSTPPPFQGKAVGVWGKSSVVHGGIFVNVEVKLLGQRSFLVGEPDVTGEGKDLPKGTRVWVPVDDVEQIREYPSVEVARRAISGGDLLVPLPEILVTQRRFAVPIAIKPGEREDIAMMVLLVSRDGGATWTKAAEANSDADHFIYEAPEDGLYLFAVGYTLKNGEAYPMEEDQVRPKLKVRVRKAEKSALERKATGRES